MLLLEYWKPVLGYEGSYEVSNTGRVRSFRRGRLLDLRPGATSVRYFSVALGRNNTRMIHDLVAAAFLGPRPPGAQVLHLDGTRVNNRVSNLRYGTRSENRKQAFTDGRRKITPATLQTIREQLATGRKGVDIARAHNLSPSQISNIKHGRQFQ